MNRRNNKIKAFSLVEMIVYLALMTMISLVIVQSIVTVIRSNKESFNNNLIENSAVSVLERIKREAGRATSIDLVNSNLQSGVLQMIVALEDDSTSTVKFILQGGVVNIYESGVLSGPLSMSGAEVSALKFNDIKNAKSEALRTVLTIKSGLKTETFYSTEILRGSY